MPEYRYYCTKCGEMFKITKDMGAPAPVKCSRCGGKLERIFSKTPVIYRGSGYYTKD